MSIDVLRILAAIGIVWFHATGAPARLIGYAGLPTFLLIFFSLITIRGNSDTMSHFLSRRWHRLMKPWLFWSAVYALGKLVKATHATNLHSLVGALSVETILVGTNIHLWYLPYAFLSGFFLYVLNRWTLKINNSVVVVSAALVALLTLTICAVDLSSHRRMTPLPQWEFGLTAIPLGLAIGRCSMIPCRRARGLQLSMISVMTLAACFILVSLGFTALTVPYALAAVLVCLAYTLPVKSNGIIAALVPLTFGVYLVHPLVAYAITRLLTTERHCAAFIALTACTSGLLTLGLMRTPLRRFV